MTNPQAAAHTEHALWTEVLRDKAAIESPGPPGPQDYESSPRPQLPLDNGRNT